MSKRKIVLSYGLGVDSTAILHRWLVKAACRGFSLSDLVILTAMTGDEFEDIKRLVETHVFPLIRKHRIRYVQLARAGLLESDGVVVLSDTDQPDRLFIEGKFKLSQELLLAGTVPQVASGRRWCSTKFKGQPLDHWIKTNIGDDPYTHVIGFNADEERRVEKDQVYGGAAFPNRESSYPLIEWGWGRIACEAYLRHVFGEFWKKSACTFCPFTRGQEHVLERYRDFPLEAARALFMEYVCLALNPRMLLFGNKSLHGVLRENGINEPFRHFSRLLQGSTWALYRVRRVIFAKQRVWRKVEALCQGSHDEVLADFLTYAGSTKPDEYGIHRFQCISRDKAYPTIEETLVVAPAVVRDKSRATFDNHWRNFSGKGSALAV